MALLNETIEGSGADSRDVLAVAAIPIAIISIKKVTNKPVAYIGDTITYQLAVTNSGNVPADNLVLTDPVPNGTSYVGGSLTSSVPFTGALPLLTLTNPLAPGATAALSFQVHIDATPNPNPLRNVASAAYTYTVDPSNPDGVSGTAVSNSAATAVFKNNFSQQITDLIESIALEEAALAAIENAEGAKIQRIAAMSGITTGELLCLNKSVTETLQSIAILQSILRQKLSIVECQISPVCL